MKRYKFNLACILFVFKNKQDIVELVLQRITVQRKPLESLFFDLKGWCL